MLANHLATSYICGVQKKGWLSIFAIMNQLSKAMVMPAELETQTLSFFTISCRGKLISFHEYYNFRSYLDEEKIPNHRGMVPLTSIPGYPDGYELHRLQVQADTEYYDNGISTHIWDLSDPRHRDYIHQLFTHVVKYQPKERYVHLLTYNLIRLLNMLQCLDIFSRSLKWATVRNTRYIDSLFFYIKLNNWT